MASPQGIAGAAQDASSEARSRLPAFTVRVTCLLLLLIPLAVYWPVTHHGFVIYDDPSYVTSNPHVQAGLTGQGTAWAFRTFETCNWHPLTWLSLMIDAQLFGKGATGFHGVNLLLHLANTLALYFLLRAMTGAHWRSAIVAGLFALHPLHVESVAWVAERKDVLSTFFGLLSLCAYAGYARVAASRAPDGGGPRPLEAGPKRRAPLVSRAGHARLYYAGAVLLFALSLMSKPMLVTLPFLLLLLDYWPLARFQRADANWRVPAQRLFREKLPFLMLSLGSCVVTLYAQKGAMQALVQLPLANRVANALVSYARYLAKAFWPVDLALPYRYPDHWPWTLIVIAAFLVATLSVGAARARRRFGFVFTGWFWFWGTLVPVIGLVQVGAQAMADRYTYFPLVGLLIVTVWSGHILSAGLRLPRILMAGLAAGLLIVCGALARRQVGWWRDDDALFGHAAAVTKDNYVALDNLGISLAKRGRYDEAMSCYQRALAAKPDYVEAMNNMGVALAAKNSPEDLDWFRRALELDPEHVQARFNLGVGLAARGQLAEAVACFEAALERKHDHFEARNNLAGVLLKLNRGDEAIDQYRLALQINPYAAPVHKNLAIVLAGKGKLDQAVVHYRQALALQPADAGAHYNLALALARQGLWDQALQQSFETLRLVPNDPYARYNLGYALKEKRRLDEAVTQFTEALRLKPDFEEAKLRLRELGAEPTGRSQ